MNLPLLKRLAVVITLTGCVSVYAQKNLPDPEGLHGTHPSDCNRATPSNCINDSVFPGSKFLLAKDSMNGYNWVSVKNGDKLLLINCGCDDYTLVFQFTTSRFSADTTNYAYWYPKAAELMHEVATGMDKDLPLDIKKGADTLQSYIQHYPDSLNAKQHVIYYNYDKDPPADVMSDPNSYAAYMDMFSHILLTRIENLGNGKYMVEVYVSISLSME